MSFETKTESGAPEIEILWKEIESGKSIEGRRVDNLTCLDCDKTLPHAAVHASGAHEADCLWNYFVRCPHCNYENNLAKFVPNYECRCHK